MPKKEKRFAVGLPEAMDAAADRLAVLDYSPVSPIRLVAFGVIEISSVVDWVGVPAPSVEMETVHLAAPEPKPGETPHWLEFRPGEWRPSPPRAFCCWTSDLLAVEVT